MDAELKYIIKTTVERTGIDFSVKRLTVSDGAEYGKLVQDPAMNKTTFRFAYKGEDYSASISGADKVAANYAYLLSGLLENTGSADIALNMNEYLKKIILGDCSRLQVQKFHVKFNVPDVPCYVFCISYPTASQQDVMNLLESYSANTLDTAIDTEDGCFAFVKLADGPSEAEYQSPGEFAEYLYQSLFEELGVTVNIGVGTLVRHLSDAHQSYRQASDALKMSKLLNSKGQVHSYKEFVLLKMLEDIPRAKLNEYLEILSGDEGKAIFGDPDMINTAEEFLENSLNVSETARELYMHRNTLIYRLDKIEKATGLNIKNFSDAVTFRLITILRRVLG